MKNRNLLIYIFISVLALTSCGEDRTNEYLEQTKENQWIYTTMQEVYLWKEDIKDPEYSQFFTPNSKFFSTLLNKNDKASFFTDINPTYDYGMNFVLMRDPIAEKPSRVYALVLSVEHGSPAEKAGITRGKWISAINKKQLSTSSEKTLKQGNEAKLATAYIEFDNEAGSYFWVASDTIEISPSAPYDACGICIDSIYAIRDNNVGYILCNSFDGEDFIDKTNAVIEKFIAQNVTNVIIDLRYNGGGNIDNATAFASMLVPAELAGTPFCTLKDNNGNTENAYNYKEQQYSIGDKKIYFIIGEKTKGTAELVVSSVNASRDMYDAYTIGATTAGVNIMTEEFKSPYGFAINPATSVAYSSNGEILPAEGIKPDYMFDELEQKKNGIYLLGDKQEFLLYNTFYIIEYGTPATY